MGGDAFAATCEAEVLGGGGFYGDGFDGEGEVFGDVLNHLGDVGEEFWSLCNDCDIYVDGGQVALFADYAGCLAQKMAGICSFVAWVGVGEMVADVAEGGCAEHGVGEGVQGDICVAVAEEASFVGDFNSAKD